MFCGNRIRALRRGMAAFLLLVLMGSSTAFGAEVSPAGAATGGSGAVPTQQSGTPDNGSAINNQANANGEDGNKEETEIVTTVSLEGKDSEADKAVDEIAQDNNVVMFSQTQPVTSKKVYLYHNKTIKYESYQTHEFHVKCDGEKILAYCIEPGENWGGEKNYKAVPYDGKLMRKALYYCYGNPGYSKLKSYLSNVSRKSCYKGSSGVYALCHIMLSYIYDGESGKDDAFKGCSSATKKVVKNMLAAIKTWPGPPETSELGLSAEKVKAVWDEEKNLQITPDIKVMGTEGNSVSIPVPQGSTLVSGEESVSGGNKTLKVGESFHYTAPASVQNQFSSGLLAGSMQSFQPYLISSKNKQDEIFSISTPGYVSFGVEWVDFGKVVIRKKSSDENITANSSYYSLEGAVYELFSKKTDKSYGILMTDSNGEAYIENIPYGNYYIKEKEPSRGYRLDMESHDIVVENSCCVVEVQEVPLVPSLITEAREKASGGNSVISAGDIEITDTVKYSGVTPGLEYRIEGKLMDKETGEQLANSEKQTTFTAEDSEGSIDMEYAINTRDMGGKTVVAFEKLYYGDELIASHEDINDKAQSINILMEKDEIPKTGDDFMMLILLAGIGISMLFGAAAIVTKTD